MSHRKLGNTVGNVVVDQPVDGVVYGHQPELNNYVPKVTNLLEAADVPTGPPGVLPYSLEWYAGAKDRKIAREKLKDELLVRKDVLRADWVTMVCNEIDFAVEKVAKVQAEPEPYDLAVLLARAIHERPREKKQAKELLMYDRQVSAQRFKAKVGLERVHGRLLSNHAGIIEKERLDQEAEEERQAEVEAERKKQARLQKILDKNARRLRGEQVTDTEDEDDDDEDEEAKKKDEEKEVADEEEEIPISTDGEPPTRTKSKLLADDQLDAAAGLPVPTGRQGIFSELPPLRAGGSFGWSGPITDSNQVRESIISENEVTSPLSTTEDFWSGEGPLPTALEKVVQRRLDKKKENWIAEQKGTLFETVLNKDLANQQYETAKHLPVETEHEWRNDFRREVWAEMQKWAETQ